MRILIDIGHPAHVHYFRNFISIMKEHGHTFILVARDKEVVHILLEYYKLPFVNRGSGRSGLVGKMSYLPRAISSIFKEGRKFKADLYLSFGSPYAAIASWLLRKPHIAFDDTDHAFFEHLLYVPFTKAILTPKAYLKDFGSKHIRFDGYMELSYLHPKYFKKDLQNDRLNDFDPNLDYAVIRMVSWKASHDIGLKGLSTFAVRVLVDNLCKSWKVIISSEAPLPDDLEKFRFSYHPSAMHSLLYKAKLFIGESLTMSAEAAFLGTPALCITTAKAGVTDEQVKSGIYFKFENEQELIKMANYIYSKKNFKKEYSEKISKTLENKIDITALMVWFVEAFPSSIDIIRKSPDYLDKFKYRSL